MTGLIVASLTLVGAVWLASMGILIDVLRQR